MFCKNCGNQMENAAKFCTKCGTPVAQEPKQEAPRQFGYQNSLQEGGGAQNQKTAFKGQQFSTGTSGSVQWKNSGREKKSFLGRLIKFGIIAGVILVVYFVFFGGSQIYDITTSTGIDLGTYEPIGESSTFAANTPRVYVIYSIQDIELGEVVDINWYNEGGELVAAHYQNIDFADMESYAYVEAPTGWDTGIFTVEFELNDEVIGSIDFTVE